MGGRNPVRSLFDGFMEKNSTPVTGSLAYERKECFRLELICKDAVLLNSGFIFQLLII